MVSEPSDLNDVLVAEGDFDYCDCLMTVRVPPKQQALWGVSSLQWLVTSSINIMHPATLQRMIRNGLKT